MDDKQIKLEEGIGLEEWLESHDNRLFPSYSEEKGQRPYAKRYEELKNAMKPIHDNVQIGAMAESIKQWQEDILSRIDMAQCDDERMALKKILENDPAVYLNNHGRGHVCKVIERVSEILHHFDTGHLTPYEGFFLLCAIQIHDVGNVFGRAGHERQCKHILETEGKPFIPDSFERNAIEKIALVHGGAYNGDCDTIRHLASARPLNGRPVRKRLLAGLLRFGDEMADDCTRCDSKGLEMGTILEGSRIYHQYSEALHTVKIERNSENQRLELILSYELYSDVIRALFKKGSDEKYLLDEIYDRTLKMERERRYCMRYLRPYFSLDAIRVEIIIQNKELLNLKKRICYTLEEDGYPDSPKPGSIKAFGAEIPTGAEGYSCLQREWGITS